MKVGEYIEKVIAKITLFNLFLASISLICMTLLIFTEILGRTFLGVSTLIADEMTGYFNVAVAFFGLAYTFKSGGFIRISILYDRLSEKWKEVTNKINLVASLIFSTTLLYYFWGTVQQSFMGKATSTYISRTPLYIPQSVMVIGITALILQISIQLFVKLKNIEQRPDS